MKRTNNYLITGPLSEAEDRVYDIASNLFTSVLISESIEKLEKMEDEYAIALSGSNEQEIREKETMLRACEASFQIVCSMFELTDEACQ
tara:strand:+ start:1284 stop:1550 length:267 start_codon:yes stop_codon:yes gene_type:complete